jgi:hypothetical protein
MDITKNVDEVSTSMGKFKNLNSTVLINILQFITVRENVCLIYDVNKNFANIISKHFRKDNSLNSCLKDMKSIIKQPEEFKFITNNHCNILEDNLKKFKDSYNPFTFNRAIYLLSGVIFKDLQSLDLQKNNMGQDGVILIMQLLKQTSNLLHLNLSYNNISDDGCKFLSLAFKKNNSVQILNLECNGISDQGAICLSETIVTHKSLKTLKMALNIVTFEGVKHLASLLEKNPNSTINVIDFKYNNLVIRDEFHTDHFRKYKISF